MILIFIDFKFLIKLNLNDPDPFLLLINPLGAFHAPILLYLFTSLNSLLYTNCRVPSFPMFLN